MMKTILVPTDFSRLSRVAAWYAAGLARNYKAKLVLTHVVHLEGPPRAMLKASSIEDAMMKSAQRDCKALADEIRKDTGVPVSTEVIRGAPVAEQVQELAVHAKASLVIIGTHGATGIRRIFLGSTASALINGVSFPVIAVPEHATYAGINRILYATDLRHLEQEYEALVAVTGFFEARMDVVHVTTHGEQLTADEQASVEELESEPLHPRIHFHTVRDASVIEGIDRFAATHRSDLIALFTHHVGFLEKLFGKSVTMEMTFHGTIPLLSMQK